MLRLTFEPKNYDRAEIGAVLLRCCSMMGPDRMICERSFALGCSDTGTEYIDSPLPIDI